MRFLFILLASTLISITVNAQKTGFEKTWYNQEKTSQIRIFKATDGKYYGKIVWLKEPNGANGKPRLDDKNPDADRRSKTVMDMNILTGFTLSQSNPNVLEGGKVYDPNNGKTYCGELTLQGATIDLKGYICSLPFLSRTSEWTLAAQ